MCSNIPHVLLIGLVISDFSGYSVGEDALNGEASLTAANGTVGYRSPLRVLDHRNRTGASEKIRGRHSTLAIRITPSQKRRQRQRITGHVSDQQVLTDPLQSVINGSVDTSENEVQLRRALRQKRKKLKRLWQEIDRIQRALKMGDGGRQRNGKETEDGKGKAKLKTRKSHWRRRMMQRLKLLSRQLQEQQQRTPTMDTVEKLYALLALEPMDGAGKGNNRGNNVGDRNGRRASGRKTKKHRGQHHKGNATIAMGGLDAALPALPARPSATKHGTNDLGNRTALQALSTRQRLPSHGGSRTNPKSGSVAGLGRTVVKKGEAGSMCTSHKNCKPGFCCHQTSSVKSPSLNATNSVCVEHRLKQSQACANSCQCDNGLQCFISRKDKLYHKRLPPPDSSSWSSSQRDEGSGAIMITQGSFPSSSDGQCKIPAMDDVLHGTYIIGDHALFKSNP